MTMRAAALAVAACLALAGAAQRPPPAVAAPFTVKQCNSATSYTDFVFQSYINGNIRNGGTSCQAYALYTIANPNVTYSNGTWGGFTAYAPGGLSIVGFNANVWGLYSDYAPSPGNDMKFIGEACPASNCSLSGRFLQDNYQLINWSYGARGVAWNGAGGPASSVFLGFKCTGVVGACDHRGLDMRLRFRDATFTIDDPSAPAVPTVGGSLTTPGWKRGTETLTLSAGDGGSGVAAITPAVDQGTNPTALAGDCPRAGGYFIRIAACALSRSGTVSVNTAAIASGTRTLSVRASDAAGTSSAARTVSVKIDNEPPPAPSNPAVVGGSNWRRANDFSIRWTNPAESDRAPLVRSHWRACPVGGGACVQGDGEGTDRVTGISLPRPGQWATRTWVEDSAMNGGPGDARRKESAAVLLRYDPDPAQLSFEALSVNDPLRVAARAVDMSGLSAGELELRRRGETSWREIPTVRQGDTLVGEIPDSTLPDGTYDLRARALDQAGNETIATQPAARTLPVRLATAITAGAVKRGKRRCVRPRAGQSKRTVRRCRRRTRLVRSVRARYGRRVRIVATVRGAGGEGLKGAPLAITFAESGGPVTKIADVRADGNGRIAYRAKAARNGTIAVRYPGTRRVRGAVGTVRLRVPASITIRPSRRRLFNEEEVVFSGRVRGAGLSGKLLELQARVGREWRTFKTTRAGRRGRWRAGHRFSAVTSRVRLTFRACAPAERAYPFARGCSRKTTVSVRPL